MAIRDSFNDEEWSKLIETPLLVFQAVAGADGKIDKKEKKAFKSALSTNKVDSELASAVLKDANMKYGSEDDIPDNSLSTIALKLQDVHETSKKNIDEPIATHFKKVMIALGLHIGNSSGGFFGSNLSDEEVDALKKVGNYMNLSVAQLQQSPTVQEIADKLK